MIMLPERKTHHSPEKQANSFRNTVNSNSRETIFQHMRSPIQGASKERYNEQSKSKVRNRSRNITLAPLQSHAHGSFMFNTTSSWLTVKDDPMRIKPKLTPKVTDPRANIVFDMTIQDLRNRDPHLKVARWVAAKQFSPNGKRQQQTIQGPSNSHRLPAIHDACAYSPAVKMIHEKGSTGELVTTVEACKKSSQRHSSVMKQVPSYENVDIADLMGVPPVEPPRPRQVCSKNQPIMIISGIQLPSLPGSAQGNKDLKNVGDLGSQSPVTAHSRQDFHTNMTHHLKPKQQFFD